MERSDAAGDGQTVPLWPLTVGSPLARVGRRIAGPLTAALGVLTWYPMAVPFAPPLTKRLRNLNRGHTITFDAVVVGSADWCPQYPDPNRIRLTRHSAVSTLGRYRTIPLARLTPIALHQPQSKNPVARLPRPFWVLDLDGSGGQGSIAARLDDLALVAAVAGWPPPPELTRLAR